MLQIVHLVILAFVVSLDSLVMASGYYDHPRKHPQYQDVAALNSSSVLSDDIGKSETAYFAIYRSYSAGAYFGATVTFDVQDFPNLKDTEVSSSKICIQNFDDNDARTTNSLQAGWQTDAGKTTGCYNLNCTGFVPVNGAPITPGDTLEPTNGKKKISVKIFKDKDDGDWWLHYGSEINNLRPVGYWPKSLLTNMQDHASQVAWSGVAHVRSGESSPPMGNGQCPGETSASVENVQYEDSSGQANAPPDWILSLHALASNKNCYQVSPFEGNKFYYGGPGGCKN